MKPVQLFCWHFMSYPYLAKDFDEKENSGWVTVPNRLWDNNKARGLYQEYIDQLVYADELGFDGMVLNEHHQNIYGLMPSPNMIAAALTQNTSRGKIIILGNQFPEGVAHLIGPLPVSLDKGGGLGHHVGVSAEKNAAARRMASDVFEKWLHPAFCIRGNPLRRGYARRR